MVSCRMISDSTELAALETLQCPDCGGKLLRGSRDGTNRNYTCRSCASKFDLIGIDWGTFLGAERLGKDEMQAKYFDPTYPSRECDFCGENYTGPAVYCSLGCALEDAR